MTMYVLPQPSEKPVFSLKCLTLCPHLRYEVYGLDLEHFFNLRLGSAIHSSCMMYKVKIPILKSKPISNVLAKGLESSMKKKKAHFPYSSLISATTPLALMFPSLTVTCV